MIVVEKIMMQRRDPNGLQKEYHKSDRIATAMCDAVIQAGIAALCCYENAIYILKKKYSSLQS